MLGRGSALPDPPTSSQSRQQIQNRQCGLRIVTLKVPRLARPVDTPQRPREGSGPPGYFVVMLTSKVFDPGFTSNESEVAVL